MGTKDITAEQYAKYKNCTVQNIRKHYRKTGLKNLPEVIEVKHYSRFYLFVVNSDLKMPDDGVIKNRHFK